MELIDCAILLASCAVEIYFLHSFFGMLFEKRVWFADNRLRIWLFNIVAVFLLYLCNMIGNGDTNLIVVPIISWIYTYILFHGKFGSRMLYFIMAFSIIWGSEWIYAIILGVGNDAYKTMSEMPFTVLSLKLLTYIIFIIVEQLIGTNFKVRV